MYRKFIWICALVLVLGLVLSACSGSEAKPVIEGCNTGGYVEDFNHRSLKGGQSIESSGPDVLFAFIGHPDTEIQFGTENATISVYSGEIVQDSYLHPGTIYQASSINGDKYSISLEQVRKKFLEEYVDLCLKVVE